MKVSYHKSLTFWIQYQKEVNELRAKEWPNDLNKLRRTRYGRRIWLSNCKVLQETLQPTNNNLRTSSNTNKQEIVDTNPRYKMTIRSGQLTVWDIRGGQLRKVFKLQAEQSDWIADKDEEIWKRLIVDVIPGITDMCDNDI
ncbi:hypothetical protein Tco_1292993 [Tanacetum coccineum]